MRRAQAQGDPIAEGLALDADGIPTTDPAAALAGAVLPMGGPKGSGLAMAIALMACLLADADLDDGISSMYSGVDAPQNIGHVFWFVDPAWFGDVGASVARAEAMVDRLHTVRPAPGEGVRFAGEGQARTMHQRSEHGLPVSRGELGRLADEVDQCGLPELAARIREAAARPLGAA
jgi:LDH2 family malate/lactate/ureidoglycolate dehydrogenase